MKINKLNPYESLLGLFLNIILGLWFLASPVISVLLLEQIYIFFNMELIGGNLTVAYVCMMMLFQVIIIAVIALTFLDYKKPK